MQNLRLFCDVVKHRSFSEAAAAHGITQSAASQRIGQLEKRLGAQLIDRSVRPLALTPAGELYLHEASELVERHERLEQRIASLGTQPQGHVSVAAIYSAGIGLLNSIKKQYVQRYPGVSVSLDYKRPNDVYETVRHGRCDLGILSYPQQWRGVEVIALRDERMAVVCKADHELAGRQQVQAVELARWPLASFETQLPVGRHIRRYLKDQHVKPQFTSVFDNIDTIKGALSVTDQIAILPKRTVLREVAAGSLAVVDLEPLVVRPMAIVYRKARGNGRNGNGHGSAAGAGNVFSPPVQAFVDLLLHHAGPDAVEAEQAQVPGQQLTGDQR